MNEEAKYWKEKYENLKNAVSLSADQITIADGNGVFLEVYNPSKKYFGARDDELIGKSAFDLEKEGVFDLSSTAEVLRRKQKVKFVQKIKGDKVILVTGYPVFDEDGNINKVINVSYNITEQKVLEQQLKETESTLKWYKNEVQLRSYDNNRLDSENKSMSTVKELIGSFASKDVPILLLGDTGVGKNYTAQYIHNISQRRKEPLMTINCGAIPAQLIESELFGYEKGSFTGALDSGKEGLFQMAGEGTLFLDEIAEMPLELQVKLLTVLDEKKFRRIGGHEEIHLKARLITATNQDLEQAIKNGTFRQDLYYRINILPIKIPSLVERIEDIPSLIDSFLKTYNDKYETEKKISPDAYEEMLLYKYPGNVRELKNIMERLVIMSNGDKINADDVKKVIDIDLSYIKKEESTKDIEIVPLKEGVANYEKNLLIAAAKKYKTTREQAKALKIDQSTVVKKRQKYSLS